MRYPVELVLGVFRAFGSGAWLWRVLFWTFGALPLGGAAATQFPKGRQMLVDLGLSSLTVWQFVFFAAAVATLFFAAKVTLFETARIKLGDISVHVDDNRVGRVRAEIRNVSGKDIQGVKASLETMRQFVLRAYQEVLDFPVILLTQQRMRRLSESDKMPPQKRFDLSARDYKNIELLQVSFNEWGLKIQHEAGLANLKLYDTLFEYRIIGGYSDITFWVKFLYDPQSQRYIVLQAKDRAMLMALEMLGNQGWWENDLNGTRSMG